MAWREADTQRLKAVLHLATPFSLSEFMRYPQLWCPAIRRLGQVKLWISNKVPNLLVL